MTHIHTTTLLSILRVLACTYTLWRPFLFIHASNPAARNTAVASAATSAAVGLALGSRLQQSLTNRANATLRPSGSGKTKGSAPSAP